MDLFEAFPSLKAIQDQTLSGKRLRLIALSGFVYDEHAFYFEIRPSKFWGRSPNGEVAVGLGLPKVNPDGMVPTHKSLMHHLHNNWRCDTTLFLPGYGFLIDEQDTVSLLPQPDIPFLMQMTLPRLGGADIPDALVQAVFLLPVRRFTWEKANTRADLVRIERSALTTFLENEQWLLEDLRSHRWCDFRVTETLPNNAIIRPVLTLRSMRNLLLSENINLAMLTDLTPN